MERSVLIPATRVMTVLIVILVMGVVAGSFFKPYAQTLTDRSLQNIRVPVIETTSNNPGKTIKERFPPPAGYARKEVDPGSFAHYLRTLPLKPPGTKVRYYNGREKPSAAYEAVVDMTISGKDLQQCADAVMRLRAEYFYAAKAYDKISFILTNGFRVDYSEWIEGRRVLVKGNKTSWIKSAAPSNTYKDFQNYMEFIFMYAGTVSLSKSLYQKNMPDLSIGDVFIIGGTPGHAVIVVDMAENNRGEKIFMLAQSYMPAQETQVLKNHLNKRISPWYQLNATADLHTPEWTFKASQLKGW